MLKQSILIIIASIYVLPTAVAAQICNEPPILSSELIGSIELGSSIKRLTSQFKYKTEQLASDGDDYLRYEIELCPNLIVVAETAVGNDKIYAISSSSPYFVTASGARAGMTVSELQALYPKGKTFIGPEEGWYAYFSTTEGIFFSLDKNAIPRDCFETARNCELTIEIVKSVNAYIQH